MQTRSVQEQYIVDQGLALAMQEAVDQLCQERPADGVRRLSQLLLVNKVNAEKQARTQEQEYQQLGGKAHGPFAAKAFTMFLSVWPKLLSATKPIRLGLADGSIPQTSPLSPWRQRMVHIVDGNTVQVAILFMLLADCFVVAMEIAINYTACYDDFRYSETQEHWHHRLHLISLGILWFMATQLALEAFAYGAVWFSKCLNYLDVLIIGSSIVVEELNLGGSWMPLLLLWRVLRVGHAIFTAVETEHLIEERNDDHELQRIEQAVQLHGDGLSPKAAKELMLAIKQIMTVGDPPER